MENSFFSAKNVEHCHADVRDVQLCLKAKSQLYVSNIYFL